MDEHELLQRYRAGERDFAGLKLAFSRFTGSDLRDVNLSCVSLFSARLSGADLAGADLSGANLTGAELLFPVCSLGVKGACHGFVWGMTPVVNSRPASTT